MPHIILVRHGEVTGNSVSAGGRLTFAGWADKALTERGERQAEAVAQRLQHENLTAIYASDLQRAAKTAQEIAAFHALEVRIDARLREVNYGEWEGLGLEEILRDWPDVWHARNADAENVATPDGESYADLWNRVMPFWDEMLCAHDENARIAIVAHNGTLRILLCRLLGMPLSNFKRIQTSNCGISRLEVKRIEYSKYEVVAHGINEINHLQDVL